MIYRICLIYMIKIPVFYPTYQAYPINPIFKIAKKDLESLILRAAAA